ncbi:DUF2330 domain-containing protein [Streptomyces sp. NPDC005811]|uniref:DUF2330 domain-containing protein n=1 Tax=Streptomyces sp. NPDC005811 TaxID=3154565 RepID=UPI0033D67575
MRPRAERRGAGARLHARIVAVLLALLALQLGSLVAPAYACACGALVPGDGRQLSVGREVSVVRWDGRQEQIVMSLRVGGDAERAAWIMPVPHRATVELGNAELFDQLATATAPVQRARTHFWPQDGDWPLTAGDGRRGPPPPPAGSGEVGVVGRERLGPFDVARLTATDPAALDDWLSSNDFTLPAGLETALRPYVDRRWEYVAVKLTPETAGGVLGGELQPLHLTFAADAPVYPMRLSRLAATPQSLGLYVLAAHRMEPVSRIGGERPRVTFAGRVGASAGGPLGELAQGTPFLTAVAQEFPRPSAISGDHELRRASADTAFRQVIYEDRLLRVLGIPVWLLTVVGGLTAAVAASVALALHRRRPHRTTQPGPRHASGHHAATGGGAMGGPPGGVPGAALGGAPGAALGGAAGGVPGAAPGGTPGAAPGGAPGRVPGGTPGAAPAGTAGGAPGGTAGAGLGGVPGAAPGGKPGRVPGGSPGGVPGASPGAAQAWAPGGAANETPRGGSGQVAGVRARPRRPERPVPLVPPMPGVPPVPPMPTAPPAAAGVPPRPTNRPSGAAVPPMPPMPPLPAQPEQSPRPQPTARHAQSAQRPLRPRWPQWPQRAARQSHEASSQAHQAPQTPPPPLHPPTAYNPPDPSPAPAAPPRSPSSPKPFTLPVTPGPNG